LAHVEVFHCKTPFYAGYSQPSSLAATYIKCIKVISQSLDSTYDNLII